MDGERFRNSPVGELVPIRVIEGEQVFGHEAFLPSALPESVHLSATAWAGVTAAAAALARLDGAAHRLPNPYLLVRPALFEEAVSTSALEGTYTELTDVIQAEFLDQAEVSQATAEVRNYIRAAELGLELIKTLPICLRLVKEIHAALMEGARGDHAEVGQFRRRQNWIGRRRGEPITESLFVPPPPGDVLEQGLDGWEKWVNADSDVPVLIRAALSHYQFDALHPFIDGNGRVGRLLIVLTLIESGELRVPLLNLSPYLEQHKDEYLDHLRRISETGDFEPWIEFFMTAVREQSRKALVKADKLTEARDEMVRELRSRGVRGVALQITEDLIGGPAITPSRAAEKYGVSYEGANVAIRRLEEEGILREATGRSYGRIFMAPRVVSVLSE